MNSGFFDTDITVVKELQKHYQVEWFVLNKGNQYSNQFFYNYVKNTGINLHLYTFSRQSDIKLLWIYLQIVYLIIKTKSKIIYTCNYDLFWSFWVTLFIKRSRLVKGIHDVEYHSDWEIPLLLKLCRSYMFKWPKYFVLHSQNQKDIFDKKYAKDSFLVFMSSKDFGKPTITKPDIEKKVKFIFWGSIQPYKGVDLLIDAIENLNKEGYDNFEVSIYGKFRIENSVDKNYPELCKSKIKTNELYNLQFRFIENGEIPDLMENHHFFVMPYRDATQSGPLMTAINYTLPVIAPDFGIFTETLTHGNDSILYNKNDCRGLEKALLGALKMDKESYRKMLRESSALKEQYSEKNIALNYKKYFDKIISVNEKIQLLK